MQSARAFVRRFLTIASITWGFLALLMYRDFGKALLLPTASRNIAYADVPHTPGDNPGDNPGAGIDAGCTGGDGGSGSGACGCAGTGDGCEGSDCGAGSDGSDGTK